MKRLRYWFFSSVDFPLSKAILLFDHINYLLSLLSRAMCGAMLARLSQMRNMHAILLPTWPQYSEIHCRVVTPESSDTVSSFQTELEE